MLGHVISFIKNPSFKIKVTDFARLNPESTVYILKQMEINRAVVSFLKPEDPSGKSKKLGGPIVIFSLKLIGKLHFSYILYLVSAK